MIKFEINLPEVRKMLQALPKDREKLFEMMRFDVQGAASKYLNGLMKTELSFLTFMSKLKNLTEIGLKLFLKSIM